jgi:hypothetical protein
MLRHEAAIVTAAAAVGCRRLLMVGFVVVVFYGVICDFVSLFSVARFHTHPPAIRWKRERESVVVVVVVVVDVEVSVFKKVEYLTEIVSW